MPRGLWTQSIAILTRGTPSFDALRTLLAPSDPQERTGTATGWLGSERSLLLPYRTDVNGVIEVDVIERPWPDGMGDPEADPDLFGAWSMGAFGPGAFPDNLARAVQQCMPCPDEAASAASEHGAFIRARISYVYGAGEDAQMLPDDHDPVGEVALLAELGAALLDLDGALAYFAPGGEVVLDRASLLESLRWAREESLPPLDAFSNIRLFQIGEAPGWALMDTVGMDALFLPDIEACVPASQDLDEVANWLRNMQLYLLENGAAVEPGLVIAGPGGRWRCVEASSDGLIEPPRNTFRWAPADIELPDVFLGPPPEEAEG
ncbi:MAG: DUF4261 domain-containing protein [Sandaracinaceae bacterium]